MSEKASADVTRAWRSRNSRPASYKAKGAFVSESALHIFDGGKPNSVAADFSAGMIIYLVQLAPNARCDCSPS